MGMANLLPPAITGAHIMPRTRVQPTSAAMAEFLETAAKYDRQAAEAQRPSQKLHCISMAKAYRFLAEQQAIVDKQLASSEAPPGAAQQRSKLTTREPTPLVSRNSG